MSTNWQTEIHDSEIFLLYKGGQAGVLFPHAGFSVERIREVVATLNKAEPPEAGKCCFCGGSCAPGDCVVVFTPITDCEHKNAKDGCCSHPKNMTPECHVGACPRLHPRIKI